MTESIDDKVRNACHRIEELYYETNGNCIVSFSGGKDSTVILALIKMCSEVYTLPENGIKAIFADTGIELDITYKFVKWCKESEWYSNIEIIHPIKPFGQILKEYGKPMLSKLKSHELHQWHCGKKSESLWNLMITGTTPQGKKYSKQKIADKDLHMLSPDFPIIASEKCCTWMKKEPFKKYAKENKTKGIITGIRMGEGGARELATKERVSLGGKLCTYYRGNIEYKYPIVDWSDKDVDAFIEKYKIPLSDAYTKFGFTRTGCMACPYARDVDNDLKYLFENEPNKYKASMFWLKDVYIAQNVILPFDTEYEADRRKQWGETYEPMRQEMLRKYRPNSRLIKKYQQIGMTECEEK